MKEMGHGACSVGNVGGRSSSLHVAPLTSTHLRDTPCRHAVGLPQEARSSQLVGERCGAKRPTPGA